MMLPLFLSGLGLAVQTSLRVQALLFSGQADLQVHNCPEGMSAYWSVGHIYFPSLLSESWFSPEDLELCVPCLSGGICSLLIDHSFTPDQMLPWPWRACFVLPLMGQQKTLLLVFHLREIIIVSLHLQNYNILYLFPKPYPEL